MFEFHEDRINWDAIKAAKKAQAEGTLVVGGIPGGFDTARELMGEEVACLCYYEQPELMFDILQTLGDTAFKVFERISEKLTIDHRETQTRGVGGEWLFNMRKLDLAIPITKKENS